MDIDILMKLPEIEVDKSFIVCVFLVPSSTTTKDMLDATT